MNNTRRKKLSEINEEIRKVYGMLSAAYCELSLVYEEEENIFGNLSDGLQATYNGQVSEEAIGNMSEAVELLDVALEKISDATDCIEEAQI